jgi:hypothetical protein
MCGGPGVVFANGIKHALLNRDIGAVPVMGAAGGIAEAGIATGAGAPVEDQA